MTITGILNFLQQNSNNLNLQGMGRYGINVEKAFGVKIPILRQMAKRISAQNTRSARWIAADAQRELRSEKQQKRILKISL